MPLITATIFVVLIYVLQKLIYARTWSKGLGASCRFSRDFIECGETAELRMVVENAKALCSGLQSRKIDIVSGGTDNHLMLVDLRSLNVSGKDMQNLLEEANITANKNTIPNDPKSPFVTSGIRLGTPAATSRGLKCDDFDKVAEAIATVIKEGEAGVPKARAIVDELTAKYPIS